MTTPENEHVPEQNERQLRIDQVKELKKEGRNPYVGSFDKTHTTAAISALEDKGGDIRDSDDVFKDPQRSIKTAGRIVSWRDHGKIVFFNISDTEGRAQICLKKDTLGENTFNTIVETCALGDFVGIEGEAFITKQGKLAVLAVDVVLLSKAVRPIPGEHYGLEDTELRYRKRYLDLIANSETLERFKVRSKVVQSLRQWLLEKNFVEVMTRTLQSVPGGAMAETFVTHHNALDHDFHLRISPELDLKMAVAGGFERVFEFSTNFRNEGIDPTHLQEFQMLEWYAAYKDYRTGIAWTEDMLRNAIEQALGKLQFTIYDKAGNEHEIDFSKPIPQKTFADVFQSSTGLSMHASHNELVSKAVDIGIPEEEAHARSRGNLVDDIYKKEARPHLIEPLFITHYPADVMPLARPNDDDPSVTDSYQLLIASWEVAKGYSELVDPVTQRQKFEEQLAAKKAGDVEAMDVNEEFLVAMEHGMPPMTGWGMGIDRFVALITGQRNIRDTVLFPLMKPADKSSE